MVGEIWQNDKLTSHMIEKLFKMAGITLNTDKSEDDLFMVKKWRRSWRNGYRSQLNGYRNE